MSIYTDCTAACEALMQQGELFTETDVVIEAAKLGKWSKDDFDGAARKASMAVGTKYRERKLARYGPVIIPGLPEPDYARIGGKIVHAHGTDGPKEFQTPNGNFPRLLVQDDSYIKQGRRLGTARDDRNPWSEQNLPVIKVEETSRERELRTNLEAAHQRIREQDEELDRLRAVLAAQHPDSPDKVEDLLRAAANEIEQMRERLSKIEEREARRAEIYNAA